MKIRIIAVGKLKRGPIAELMDDYKKRCKWPIQITEIDHSTKSQENSQLKVLISPEDYIIVMDEGGNSWSSPQLAMHIENLMTNGTARLTFIIGGSYGLEPELMEKAHKKISFGAQTWPHMFVRLMLVEQLYRAEAILTGHPYHH